MSLPVTDREVYAKNPLREVICQMRFPSILAISAGSPVDFQEGIRANYPIYEHKTVQMPNVVGHLPSDLPPEIAKLIASAPLPFSTGMVEHHFSTAEGERTISLTQEFVSVTEYKYTRWEAFRKEVHLAEQMLQETYQPAFFHRLGLRYIDVLDREECGLEGIPWAELLNPYFISVLGSSDVASDVRDLTVQSMLKIPDVEQGQVLIRHGLAASEGDENQKYIIDADFHTNGRSMSDDVFSALDNFHKWAGNLFRWATTDKLRAALEPTKI